MGFDAQTLGSSLVTGEHAVKFDIMVLRNESWHCISPEDPDFCQPWGRIMALEELQLPLQYSH